MSDRAQLFQELAQRREFEPEPFAPPPRLRSKRKAKELEAEALAEIDAGSARFVPRVREYRMAQAAGLFVSLLGLGMRFATMEGAQAVALPCMGLGLGAVLIVQWACGRARERQHAELRQEIEVVVRKRLRSALEELGRHDEARSEAALERAAAEHATVTESACTRFEQEETERLQAIRELRDGQPGRIRDTPEALLPLELPIPCAAAFEARSAAIIALDVDLPEPSVLPTNEAKLLASGKVSYKDKPEKRLREQYLRLAAGSAMRHAAEVMRNVPTCQTVEVGLWRVLQDPSTGKMRRSRVLEAAFDYPTLAPMSMDAIDPSAALKHFRHRINLDRGKDLRPLDEGKG